MTFANALKATHRINKEALYKFLRQVATAAGLDGHPRTALRDDEPKLALTGYGMCSDVSQSLHTSEPDASFIGPFLFRNPIVWYENPMHVLGDNRMHLIKLVSESLCPYLFSKRLNNTLCSSKMKGRLNTLARYRLPAPIHYVLKHNKNGTYMFRFCGTNITLSLVDRRTYRISYSFYQATSQGQALWRSGDSNGSIN